MAGERRVLVVGALGRMGICVRAALAEEPSLRLGAALESPGHPRLGETLEEGVVLGDDPRPALAVCEVAIDFSLPAATLATLRAAAAAGVAYVTGTTGFSAEQDESLNQAARKIALVVASNMSRGVYTLSRLTELAAQALPDHEAAIVEIHHNKKVDAPSGTALQLAATVESAGGHQVEISAVRGGDVVGEHQVMFLGPGEQIILTHRATTREHFCRGAVAAVRFVAGAAPGLYSMADVFKED